MNCVHILVCFIATTISNATEQPFECSDFGLISILMLIMSAFCVPSSSKRLRSFTKHSHLRGCDNFHFSPCRRVQMQEKFYLVVVWRVYFYSVPLFRHDSFLWFCFYSIFNFIFGIQFAQFLISYSNSNKFFYSIQFYYFF